MPSFPLACRSQQQAPDDRFPVVAARGSAYPVVLEPDDGTPCRLPVRSLLIQAQRDGHVRGIAAVRRGAGELLVTDARVVLAGARPAADTLMTGHVRCDWVVAVGGCTAGGRFRDDALRLVLQLDNGEYVVLTLTFGDGADVHGLAQDIARRTARRWLALQGDSPLASGWEELARAGRLSADPGEFALHFTPSHTRVVAPASGSDDAGLPA